MTLQIPREVLKVDSVISALDHVRKSKFSSIVHVRLYKQIVLILSCFSDSAQVRTIYLSFGTCHEVNIMQLCSFSIHK